MTQQAETQQPQPHVPPAAASAPAPTLPAPAGPVTTSLVLRATDDAFRIELEPRSLADLYKLSEFAAEARMCGISTPADCVLRVLAGRDLGLTFMQSLQGLYTFADQKGGVKLGMWADMMRALIARSPIIEEFRIIEATADKATIRVKRRDEKQHEDISWTREDSVTAGLVGRQGKSGEGASSNNHDKYPADMNVARATSRAARRKCSDIIKGMATVEEIHDAEEFVGEVVHTPPTVHAASRPWNEEASAFDAAIDAAAKPADMRSVREKVDAWDGPDALRQRVLDHYNARANEIRAGRSAAKPAAHPTAEQIAAEEALGARDAEA